VSEGETPEEAVGDLLLKYVKDNIGAALGLFEHLTSSVENAIAASSADAASKVRAAVRLGEITQEVEILKVVAPKDGLSDALLEAISVLLRALADVNAGRLDDVERELLELGFNLDKILDRVYEGCTRAQAGGSGQA